MKELTLFNETPMQIRKNFGELAEDLKSQIEAQDPMTAFRVIDAAIDIGMSFTQGSMLYTIHAIALSKEQWDKMDVSDQSNIAMTFYEYVSRKFGTSQNESTIDNYVNVAQTWLIEESKVEVPEKTLVFEIEKGSAVTWTDEEGDSCEIPTSVWNVQYSKLLASTGRAAKGKMDEEDWGLLFNPKVSQEKLLNFWRGPKAKEPRTSNLVFQELAGWICVSDGENFANLAEIDYYEINNNPLAKQGWMRLQAVIRMEDGDDF